MNLKRMLDEYFRRHFRLFVVLIVVLFLVAIVAMRFSDAHGSAVVYQAF